MRHNIENTVLQYNMLPEGTHVVVGFSGGADSVALLSFLYEKQTEWHLKLIACHINHQLRGAEAMRDEEFCRRFCRERGIELRVFRENIREGAEKAQQSIEEYARGIRYQRFEELSDGPGDRIATAHNLNDLAETLIFHAARGTGIRGLIGIPPVRGKIVRPLLYCSRQEIEKYCQENGLSFVTDSTNLSDEYTRNYIRHQILPRMEEINPAFLQSARRLSQQAMLEESCLEGMMEEELHKISMGENQWRREGFLVCHPAMQNRMIAHWLEQLPCGCSGKKLEEVRKIIQETGTLEVCRDCYFEAQKTVIHIRKKKLLQDYFQISLRYGENILFSGKKVVVLPIEREKYKFFEKNGVEDLKNVVDYDKIIGSIIIRQRHQGDAIQLPGFSKARPFKKLLNQNRISLEQRARLAVICDDMGPVWLEGFGTRVQALPTDATKHFMMIKVMED